MLKPHFKTKKNMFLKSNLKKKSNILLTFIFKANNLKNSLFQINCLVLVKTKNLNILTVNRRCYNW